jgi:hypothetical protein
MVQVDSTNSLPPLQRRMEIFHRLVVAQDYGMSIEEAREMLFHLYGLDATQVVRIEREGLENDWPPL